MTPDYETLRLERDGAVLRVVIDRSESPVNAIDGQLHADLCDLVARLKSESEARAIVLTGSGTAFSAGGDFAWIPELGDAVRRDEVRRAGKQLIWDLLDVEVPIVAAVNGPAMGLGATLVLLCDAAFMAEGAVIGDPHVRVGITAGDGGTAIWPLIAGPMVAKRYLLTGDPIEADEARRLGLVTHVVPAAGLEEAAMGFARRLAEGAPLALRYTKVAVNELVKSALTVAFDLAMAYEVVTMASEDHREALAAIRERRPPAFQGR